MSDWHSIGPHRFRYQAEVLYFEPHGELSLSQAQAWSKVIDSHVKQQRHGFLLVDARELKPPPAEIRRMFVSWWRDCQPRPRVVVFGANLLMRTVSRLVIAATRQLYHLDLNLTQFATETEAWAHIDEMRRLGPPSI